MKLIIPPHSKLSVPVRQWRDIKTDALAMVQLIEAGNFPDGLYREAFALSHSQVSYEPRQFFVVNWENAYCKAAFPHNIIINPVLLSLETEVPFEEACMSRPEKKPERRRRYSKVSVEYSAPSWFGCLKKHRAVFTGLAAFIFQHEEEHFRGIY